MIQQVLSCQTDLSTIPKKLLGSDKRKRRKEIYKPKKSLVRYFNTVAAFFAFINSEAEHVVF
jgi:hypothetical protein